VLPILHLGEPDALHRFELMHPRLELGDGHRHRHPSPNSRSPHTPGSTSRPRRCRRTDPPRLAGSRRASALGAGQVERVRSGVELSENPDGPAPLRFGLGDDPYDPDAPDGIYRGPYVTTLEELAGVESFDNLGDKLAWALALSEPAQGRTLHIRGRRRPWWEQLWLRLLPGKHCRSCGARLHRTDPQGQPSRVWWCPEHGPLENPDDGKWNAENRISYSD